MLLFYATAAKPDSLALDKEPVEEEEEDQVEEEDKVMLEKFHIEGGANLRQSELQIFQITQISQLNQGYFLKVMKTHEVYPLQGRKKVNNNCEFEMRMKMSVPLEGVVMEESKLEVLVCPW